MVGCANLDKYSGLEGVVSSARGQPRPVLPLYIHIYVPYLYHLAMRQARPANVIDTTEITMCSKPLPSLRSIFAHDEARPPKPNHAFILSISRATRLVERTDFNNDKNAWRVKKLFYFNFYRKDLYLASFRAQIDPYIILLVDLFWFREIEHSRGFRQRNVYCRETI